MEVFISISSRASESKLHAFQKAIGMCYQINIFCCCRVHRFLLWALPAAAFLPCWDPAILCVIQITRSFGKIMQGERMYLSRFIRKEREEKRNNDISLGNDTVFIFHSWSTSLVFSILRFPIALKVGVVNKR